MATVLDTEVSNLPAHPTQDTVPARESRADFFKVVIASVVGGILGLFYLITAVRYLFPTTAALGRVAHMNLSAYPFDSGVAGPLTYDFTGKGDVVGVYVVQNQGKVYGIEQTCTHLGCPIAWDATTGKFRCPCHGSAFSIAGTVEAGPAPIGLYRHEVTINGSMADIGGRTS